MSSLQIKEEIHNFINHADERFLRLVYSMIESERSEKDFYNTTDDEMMARAKKSLQSVEEGKTRSIHEFKKDIASKIIYFINEQERTVYVTDFFPCESDENKISKR